MGHSNSILAFVLLIVAAHGVFFSLSQLVLSRLKNFTRVLLAAIVLSFSILLIENVVWMFDYAIDFVHFIAMGSPIPFLMGPLTYFYFKNSFHGQTKSMTMVWHFVPFLLVAGYFTPFYFASTAAKLDMMNNLRDFTSFFPYYISGKYFFVAGSLSLMTYTFFIYHHCYSTAASMKEVKKWFYLSFFTFVFYVVNHILFHVLSYTGLVEGCSYYGVSIAAATFIALFSWFGTIRPKLFEGYLLAESMLPVQEVKYKSSALTATAEQELFEMLELHMANFQPYKNEALNLEKLADALGTSRHHLSQVINNKAGMNFFEYINYWRIKEAQRLLIESSASQLNVIEVAYMVGFNNKVSFNKSFKKITGTTPTQFRKTNQSIG